MKRNGFTLIELLVVVAIIGILAAVGVVAYSGYTAGAKKNAMKQMSSMIYKKFRTERSMCSIDSSLKIYDGTLNCSQDNTGLIIPAIENYYNHSTGITPLKNVTKSKAENFLKHRGCDEFTKDEAYGHMYLCIKRLGPGLFKWQFSTCFETPCSNVTNRISYSFDGAANYD
tara:strand:+ start:15 stop:527 length:513 start_codon:yes stop_codon:yes gene_type:complete